MRLMKEGYRKTLEELGEDIPQVDDDEDIGALLVVKKGQKKCNLCQKEFSSTPRLLEHVNTHKGEKPFKCHFCPRAYASKRNLAAHEVEHVEEPKLACDVCGKKFVKQYTLNGHKARRHVLRPRRKLQCPYCDNKYNDSKYFENHKKTCAKNPQKKESELYACHIKGCNKTFKRVDSRNSHIKIAHGGQNPVECKVCHEKFKYRAERAVHMRKEHADTPIAKPKGRK